MKLIEPYAKRRQTMVREHIAARGVTDEKVLAAMKRVPREEFVPAELRESAYADMPLPIGEGQTISQPFIVASMTEALRLTGGERVLEVGAGSGYAAAVLAEIAGEVFTIERLPVLAAGATAVLKRLGYGHVHVIEGDGTLGHPAGAPYDAIVVTAEGPHVPPALREQLKPGGRLVMPMGDPHNQMLIRLTRRAEGDDTVEELYPVRFVPLIGAEGWTSGRPGR
jgi:protein-L-isoaspartate(D-aspartate) O-methyltransferase